MERNREKGFVTLVGLLLTVFVITVIALIIFKAYFKRPASQADIRQPLSEQGIDSTNYSTIIDSTKSVINNINKQGQDALSQQ